MIPQLSHHDPTKTPDLLAGPLADALREARTAALAGDHLAAAGNLVEAALWTGALPTLVPLLAAHLGLDPAEFAATPHDDPSGRNLP